MARSAAARTAPRPADRSAAPRGSSGRRSGSRPAPAAAPRLTLVTRPQPRSSSVPFALLCTLIIGATLMAVLLLNISMSQTSYELSTLQSSSAALSEQKQALQERNEQLGTTQELRQRAAELGMVPAGQPAYIDLATGTIIGEAQPAAGQTLAPAAISAEQSAVPPARIYGESEPYYGMGNEGH